MNGKDRYNGIISMIERDIAAGALVTPAEIAGSASKESGTAMRDLGSIFTFLTGTSLISYIKERQLMHAFQSILEGEVYNWEKAFLYTAYSDQSAFTKAFKRCLGITPSEAFEQKRRDLLRPPLTWDLLTADQGGTGSAKEEDEVTQTKIFGLEAEHFQKVLEALDYQKVFGFTQTQAEAAFELYERFESQIRMELAFDFVDLFSSYIVGHDPLGTSLLNTEAFKLALRQSDHRFVFWFMEGLSIETIMNLEREFEAAGLKLTEMDPKLFACFMRSELDLPTFMRYAALADEHRDEITDYGQFLEDCEAWGPDAALGMQGDMDDFIADCDRALRDMAVYEQKPWAFEASAWETTEEEEGSGEPFVTDYDMENVAYWEDDGYGKSPL